MLFNHNPISVFGNLQ